MAGGRLGPTSRGVVLHEARAEQFTGRRTVFEAVCRLDKVAGECRPSGRVATVRRVQ